MIIELKLDTQMTHVFHDDWGKWDMKVITNHKHDSATCLQFMGIPDQVWKSFLMLCRGADLDKTFQQHYSNK